VLIWQEAEARVAENADLMDQAKAKAKATEAHQDNQKSAKLTEVLSKGA
jgi:hypothetical protein